jgi:hypothetical protein
MMFKSRIKTIESDIFIKRLRSSLIGEGMLPEGNIYLMDYAVKNMPDDGVVFEIGSYGGLSTNLILHLLEKHDKKNVFLGCDAWIYEGVNDSKGIVASHIDGRIDIGRKEYMDYIKNSFINAARLLHPKRLPYICHLDSDAFFKKWNDNEEFEDVFNRKFHISGAISFCYIDGDHSYAQTKKDFENVASKLKINGFLLLDDSAKHFSYGSAKFVKEILKNPDFKVVAVNPNYLFQKIK